MSDYHVTKRSDGQWAAIREDAKRAAALRPTQKAAQQKANQLAINSGGGEVVIHRADNNRIRNPNTKGKRDPNPPKDRKH